jgi:hypothetical protein
MQLFHKFILSWNSTCFGQFVCPSSGVYSLYTRQWYMSYRFLDWSCSKVVYKPVWHIPLLSVQRIRNAQSHVTMHGHMSRCTVTWTYNANTIMWSVSTRQLWQQNATVLLNPIPFTRSYTLITVCNNLVAQKWRNTILQFGGGTRQ